MIDKWMDKVDLTNEGESVTLGVQHCDTLESQTVTKDDSAPLGRKAILIDVPPELKARLTRLFPFDGAVPHLVEKLLTSVCDITESSQAMETLLTGVVYKALLPEKLGREVDEAVKEFAKKLGLDEERDDV